MIRVGSGASNLKKRLLHCDSYAFLEYRRVTSAKNSRLIQLRNSVPSMINFFELNEAKGVVRIFSNLDPPGRLSRDIQELATMEERTQLPDMDSVKLYTRMMT